MLKEQAILVNQDLRVETGNMSLTLFLFSLGNLLIMPDLQVVLRHEANLPLLRVLYLREGKRI